MASTSEFRRKVGAGKRPRIAVKDAKPSGKSAGFLGWFWAVVCFTSAVSAFAHGSHLAAFSFVLCGFISLPPVWRAASARGMKIPSGARIGAIVVLFFIGVSGLPESKRGSLQQVAGADFGDPDAVATRLERLKAKIGPDALFEMDYNDRDYREAYPNLRHGQFEQSNKLMSWASVAAAESDQCSQVQSVTPALRATEQTLWWTVICMRDGRYQDSFDITPEQARAMQDKYDPGATAEARAAAMQVATAEPRSARWKNFDQRTERAAVNECKNLVRSAMVNEGSFSSAWSWDTYGSHDTGFITIEQDFTAKNAFGGKISSRYRCVVDPDNGSSIRELQIREVTGWRNLI